MKFWWSLILVFVAISMVAIRVRAESDIWEEDDDGNEVLVRTVRGTKERGTKKSSGGNNAAMCRYGKGQWSECDSKTNMRQRTLSLKKGDQTCEQTKLIQKKCKKACRYDKGTLSACINMSMTRVDNIKPNSDPSCEPTRRVTKKCKTETVSTKKTAKVDRGNKKSGKQ